MKCVAPFAASVVALVLSLPAACSKQDGVVGVEADDPEMSAAIGEARETLPQFWKAYDTPAAGETDFMLKVRITDALGVEHFWVSGIDRRNGKTMGTINNDAVTVLTVKLGDRIAIPEADITDWMYMRNGKMVGNRTLGPLLKKMPEAEAKKLKELMADPPM